MFFLRVHSVDTDHPLATDYDGFSSSSPPPPPPPPPTRSPRFTERRGMVHLFRTLSHAPLSSPSARSATLFVVAVPNYFSPDDFIRFCGPRIDDVSELRFIRNDGMEDRYSVLIELTDQKAADGFYCTFNGKNFSPAEAEVCHILFLHEVDYTESADVASTPPSGFTELSSCPVCLERLDPDTSGILSTNCDHSFHCSCGTKWTYLSCQAKFSWCDHQMSLLWDVDVHCFIHVALRVRLHWLNFSRHVHVGICIFYRHHTSSSSNSHFS